MLFVNCLFLPVSQGKMSLPRHHRGAIDDENRKIQAV
jgi:hypothetical protein